MQQYMEFEATNDQELAEIKAKIEKARAWARKHFRADKAETCSFLNIAFFWVQYRLCFKKNRDLEWHGKHPFYGTSLPPLIVTLQNDGIEGG